jgi:hypothetical protein
MFSPIACTDLRSPRSFVCCGWPERFVSASISSKTGLSLALATSRIDTSPD